MINVVDEVLTSTPKYRIRDSNGNILYDNATIELVTPVQVQGTPINKALFDSINFDLNYPVQRFFGNIIPVFSENGGTNILGNWTVTPSGAYVFLRNNDNDASYYEGSYGIEQEFIIEIPKKIINPTIRFRERSTNGKIYGYDSANDTWDELYTFTTGGQGNIYEFNFSISNNKEYTKFKIVGTGLNSSFKLRIYYFGIESGFVITE